MNTTTANTVTAREALILNQAMSANRDAGDGTGLGTLLRNAQIDIVDVGSTVAEKVSGTYSGVSGMVYQGNRTVTQINALSPSRGDLYVATDSGTPSAGSSDALTAGDGAEYNGASWKKLWDGVDGVPPVGTTVVVGNGTLVSPLTDGTDEKKVATWDGLSLTPTLTVPATGDAYKVTNATSVYYGEVFVKNTTWDSVTATMQAAAISRVASTASETFFTPVKVIPSTVVAAGDVYQFDVLVYVANKTGSPTLTVKVYIGSTQMISTGTVSVAADDMFRFTGQFQVKAVGASGSVLGAMTYVFGGNTATSVIPVVLSASPDFSADNNFRASATWSASSASNQADLRMISLRRIASGT